MIPTSILLGNIEIPCKVTTGTVTVTFELEHAGMVVEIDDGQTYTHYTLARRRDFSEGEGLSIIECDPDASGRWIVVAIARHEARTWALDVDPASFLSQHSLLNTKPDRTDLSIAAAGGLTSLTLVLAGVHALLFTPVLLPLAWIEGRKFVLRRQRASRCKRFFSYVDFISQAAIGAKARKEFASV